MIDRLLSGAGAVSHYADRGSCCFARGEGVSTRRVGLVLAAILGIGGLGGLALAAENAGPATGRCES